ncbi:MAG TPA: ThuA domain-containing protein [Planctomycetaceae bacterium]|nr:ThuA domain-containing protein [Planctomycetaceae bacterium]
MRTTSSLICLILMLVPLVESAAQPKPAEKPIRALLVTGGCCHDYSRQKLILTRGISARANVVWTVVHQGGTTTDTEIPLYRDENWARGFDIVVHNECFSDAKDPAWVERILKPHREGTPAVLIHCAMHSYRTGGDQWFEFVGLQSPNHGPHFAYKVENLQPEHPIMKLLPDNWEAPKGELYHSIKLFPKATPLGQARRISDNQPQTCIWTNEYGKCRVFGTTIGHYNVTMAQPGYLDMVARGLLWALKKNPDDHFRATDEKTNAEILKLIDAPLEELKPVPESME